MNELLLVHEFDGCVARLLSGAPAPAVLGDASPEVRRYVAAFAMILNASVATTARPDFQRDLRAALVARHGRRARAGWTGAGLGRVAAASAATLLLGAAINPALAHALQKSVSDAFGGAVSQVFERVLPGVAGASQDDKAKARHAKERSGADETAAAATEAADAGGARAPGAPAPDRRTVPGASGSPASRQPDGSGVAPNGPAPTDRGTRPDSPGGGTGAADHPRPAVEPRAGGPPENPGKSNERPPENPGKSNERPPADPGKSNDNPPAKPGKGVGTPPEDPGKSGQNPPADPGKPDENPPADPGEAGEKSKTG